MSYRANAEPAISVLNDEERRQRREVAVKKSLRYFEDRKNRSSSDSYVFIRRRELSAYRGADETVSKKDLDMINVGALPMPSSAPRPREKLLIRSFR